MSESILIRIADLVGGPRAVDAADGEKVFEKILPVIKDGRKVRLSFEGITMVITAFLNAAIGKLYGSLPEEQVDKMLEVRDLISAFQPSLDKSIEWSKAYYRDPDRLTKAIMEELGDEK
jgi:MoaA/NifB/PqqE/SkfB family radical SAM enzyme